MRRHDQTMETLLSRIEAVAKTYEDDIGLFRLLASTAEELGELSQAILKPTKVTESSEVEAVDLTLCALALYYRCGGQPEDLTATIDDKLKKWEDNLRES